MITKKELAKLDVDACEERIRELDEQIAKIREEKEVIHAAMDMKNAEIDAARRYEQMSEPERAALAQYIETHGIVSEEKVAEPTANDEE